MLEMEIVKVCDMVAGVVVIIIFIAFILIIITTLKEIYNSLKRKRK